MQLIAKHPYSPDPAPVTLEVDLLSEEPENVVAMNWSGIVEAKKAVRGGHISDAWVKIGGPYYLVSTTAIDTRALMGLLWDFYGKPFRPSGPKRPAATCCVWQDAGAGVNVYRLATECRNGYEVNHEEEGSGMAAGRTEHF